MFTRPYLQQRVLRSYKSSSGAITCGQRTLGPVAETGDEPIRPRLTARGAATLARIVAAADELMHERGVTATTLADVRTASGTSKSQLYQHFADKDALVREVISARAGRLLDEQRQRLLRLDSLRGLELWRDALVERNALRNGAHGCPLGSLAAELADLDEVARQDIARYFDAWHGLLRDGLERMQSNGTLTVQADPDALATGLLAALQGGYLLAQTTRNVEPMKTALNMAIEHVRSFAS